jgi:hypothetical protein
MNGESNGHHLREVLPIDMECQARAIFDWTIRTGSHVLWNRDDKPDQTRLAVWDVEVLLDDASSTVERKRLGVSEENDIGRRVW